MHLTNAHEEGIKSLHEQSFRTVDDLPYTDEFDRMYASFTDRTCSDISKHDFWRALSGLRKAGLLRRKER